MWCPRFVWHAQAWAKTDTPEGFVHVQPHEPAEDEAVARPLHVGSTSSPAVLRYPACAPFHGSCAHRRQLLTTVRQQTSEFLYSLLTATCAGMTVSREPAATAAGERRARHRVPPCFAWCRNASQRQRLRGLQVGLDGGNDHERLDRYEVDAHERDAYPRVDHDALVENTVKSLDLAAGRDRSLDNHAALSMEGPGTTCLWWANPLPRASDDLSRG